MPLSATPGLSPTASLPTFPLYPDSLFGSHSGRRIGQGVVMELTSASRVADEMTKDILQPVEPAPLIGETQLSLGPVD